MCGFVFLLDTQIKEDQFLKVIKRIEHRGPDSLNLRKVNNAYLGFVRLAIMDLSQAGDQPFEVDKTHMMCNGEIYNHLSLRQEYEFDYKSRSDCEVILPIFHEGGIEKVVSKIRGEYAFVIYDEASEDVFAARDPMGIRPLFYGESKENGLIVFASEVKALTPMARNIQAFPPGHYYKDGKFYKYIDLSEVKKFSSDDFDDVIMNIREKLEAAVEKRMASDAEVGFLLSGGLDSSLVCAIAQKYSDKPIQTFAIGMSEDAIDLKYAKQVADHIGSDHTEVYITKDDVLGAIKEVIVQLETYDITTIRASIGMYLVCKHIKSLGIKVLLTGEVSDEIFGYKYTDFAPSPEEFQKEASKRVRELYMYDVLRADRCIAGNSLEARVPFSDEDFVQYVMSIDPKLKMNTYGHGKYLLRAAFENTDYLPYSILFREKAAFSDAVGHSLVDYLKEYAEELYSEKEFELLKLKYDFATPFTKESLLYREIFEEFYPKLAYLVSDFWMPNSEWENCDVKDPSARVLPNYGESGL